MPIDKEKIIQRIDYLIDLAKRGNVEGMGEVASGTISILEILYGVDSEKTKAYIQYYNNCVQSKNISILIECSILQHTMGVLKSIKSEVEAGLVGNLERQAQGEIFGDFITLAKGSLDENTEVAAVLVSAALEDALKRFALQNGLDVDDENMEQVINALKSKSLLKGAQASLAKNHKQLRKSAFHAQWGKIDKVSVSSAIGFTERFISENFG